MSLAIKQKLSLKRHQRRRKGPQERGFFIDYERHYQNFEILNILQELPKVEGKREKM